MSVRLSARDSRKMKNGLRAWCKWLTGQVHFHKSASNSSREREREWKPMRQKSWGWQKTTSVSVSFFFFFFTARCNVSDDNIFKTLFLLFLNHGSVADILNLTKLDKASMEKMRNVTPGIPVNVLVIACDLWISSELD